MSLTYGFCLDDPSSVYDSAQFSDAFHAVVGDGISSGGTQFSLTINGFSVTVGSGYAMVAGRWLENDEPLVMTIKPSSNNDDRVDALVIRVDYKARRAALELIADVNLADLPVVLRNDDEYSIVLDLIRVPRGASTLTPENIVDVRDDPTLCGTIVPLSGMTGKALFVYNFLQSGIDVEVERLVSLSQAVMDQADVDIANLDAALRRVGGAPEIGDLRTARIAPSPESEWLLCDGGTVPDEYPELKAMLDGVLPNLSRPDDRYRTYIYGGAVR